MNVENNWTPDIEQILEAIRTNSIILSNYHRKEYIKLVSYLKYFRIPVIILSSFGSVFNFALNDYLDQSVISSICCGMSLVTGLIGSIEMYLQIQKKMESELINSQALYLNAIDIFKVLSMNASNRNGNGVSYLEERFNVYCKLIASSNIVDKKVIDKLGIIDINDDIKSFGPFSVGPFSRMHSRAPSRTPSDVDIGLT